MRPQDTSRPPAPQASGAPPAPPRVPAIATDAEWPHEPGQLCPPYSKCRRWTVLLWDDRGVQLDSRRLYGDLEVARMARRVALWWGAARYRLVCDVHKYVALDETLRPARGGAA